MHTPPIIALVGDYNPIGTLFQPERSALQHRTHPLIHAFVEAVLAAG